MWKPPICPHREQFSGDLQSLAWFSMALGGVLGSLAGGPALRLLLPRRMFALFALCPALQLLMCCLTSEGRLVGEGAGEGSGEGEGESKESVREGWGESQDKFVVGEAVEGEREEEVGLVEGVPITNPIARSQKEGVEEESPREKKLMEDKRGGGVKGPADGSDVRREVGGPLVSPSENGVKQEVEEMKGGEGDVQEKGRAEQTVEKSAAGVELSRCESEEDSVSGKDGKRKESCEVINGVGVRREEECQPLTSSDDRESGTVGLRQRRRGEERGSRGDEQQRGEGGENGATVNGATGHRESGRKAEGVVESVKSKASAPGLVRRVVNLAVALWRAVLAPEIYK